MQDESPPAAPPPQISPAEAIEQLARILALAAPRAGDEADVPPEALTRRQTASLLGISLTHLDTMEDNGTLGPMPLCLGSEKVVRYSRGELIDWLRAGAPGRKVWQVRKGQAKRSA